MHNPFAQRSHRLFLLIIAMGLLPIALLVFASWHSYPLIESAVRLVWGRSENLCNCERVALSFVNPLYWTAVLSSIGALLLSFAAFAYMAVLLMRRTRSFIYFHTRKRGDTVVASDGVFAFCYGFWRPKICVSSGLLKRLSDSEASVVWRHEEYHQKTREPLKSFIVHLIASVYRLIPPFARLAEAYHTDSELAADFFATRGFRDKRSLAGALFAMIENDSLQGSRDRLIPSFADIVDARISVLAKGKYSHRPIFTARAIPGFLLIPLFLFFLYGVIFLTTPSRAHAIEPRMCQMMREGAYQCGMRQARKS